MSVTHVASPSIEANGVMRQRCGWCGALLLEYDLSNVARPLDEGEDPENPKPWTPGDWEPFALVRVDDHKEAHGTRYGSVVEPELHEDSETRIKIPEDACMNLDPAVTA